MSQAIPDLTCPCCSRTFPNGNAVVNHLSAPGLCGEWLVQALSNTNMESTDLRTGDDYGDDPEAVQDGV